MKDLIPLDWTDPKLVKTRKGDRELRTALANDTFWTLWRSDKQAMKDAGYSCKPNGDGTWEAQHWGIPGGKTEEELVEVTNAAIDASRATDAEITVPLSDRARERGMDYFPFQKAGVAFAAERDATFLGDDMGVGKTIQIIGTINYKGAKNALIVCPASMLITWAKELYVWLAKELPVTVVTASKIKTLDEEQFPGINDQVTFVNDAPANPSGVVVINYDILHKFEDELRAIEWDVVAFDESHYAKNQKSRRTKFAFGGTIKAPKSGFSLDGSKPKDKKIAPIPGKCRILASGTPMKNRPVELFSQLNYLDPAAFPKFFPFAKRYCGAHQGAFGWDFSGSTNAAELNTRLRSTLMIRRMKSEVLTDLPEKTRSVISLPTNGATKLVEQEHAAWEAAKLESGGIGGTGVAATELARLRVEVGEAKVKHILAHLEENTEPTLLFVRHKAVQAQLAEGLADKGVVIYNGDMSPSKKEEAKVKFMEDDSVQYFIGTIGACKEGLTLTKASYVVFGELEWAPAELNQAEDRAYRQGQKNAVTVQHLVFDGSVDDKMLVGILRKQKVIDKTLDDKAKMTVEERAKIELPKDAYEKAEEKTKAEALPTKEVELLHEAVRFLAARCDGASSEDGAGFNKMDAAFGRSLARAPFLSQGQAKAAKKMIRKYKGQLGEERSAAIWGA